MFGGGIGAGGKYQAVKYPLNFTPPFFHCAESMRIARRDGEVSDFATDSITSPEISAFRGITPPFTIVAIISCPSTFVPTAVFPATTLCFRTIGSSHPTQPRAALFPVSADGARSAPGGG